MQHTAAHCSTLRHTAAHTHTATHCNTLQHTRQCIAHHAHTHHTKAYIAPRFQTSLDTLPHACQHTHTDKLIRRYTYKVVKRDRERGSEKERAREREREREHENKREKERERPPWLRCECHRTVKLMARPALQVAVLI